ncbi:Glycosyl transferase, family 2 [uncultured Synechococcales cyanobacterium]|uniref:Beta-monoglucosyldiacylglycerol synthase n=1 Tax=uncultured Synechococcales cyanobacterium TaxID=1936017 RepID=A0A6J4UL43_9CYAN|nr:Glycosyl transferase, family 2 [uncultured Synechococcales cyanobacterium]
MSKNFWPENNFSNTSEPIHTFLADLSELPQPDEFDEPYPGYEGRRRKAALALALIWSGTIALHLLSGGYWLVVGVTTLMGVHTLRVLLAQRSTVPIPMSDDTPEAEWPYVSLLVAAKNESAVIASSIRTLCNLDYPTSRYEVWIIDDGSTDQTPALLKELTQQYKQLQVLYRLPGAGGGKSGALNEVLPLSKGEIVGVFDADAQVPQDLLRRVLPLFQRQQVGAVQVRKAIANAATNFWTRGQMAEMAFDSFIQQQRVAFGGLGELRGNGQFVRRSALEGCGGWNEQTITDDLDLTLRLHLDQWDIDFLASPAVEEEGVTRALALWHQRNRWAEGGYQRYLDYWRLIVRNRLGTRKTVDLVMFWIMQYLLPTAALPDFVMAIARNRPPVLLPITNLTVSISLVGMLLGLKRFRTKPATIPLLTLLQVLRGTLYMFHWLPVIASTTVRISLRPKRLKWVKTMHQGTDDWLDVPE